MPDHHYLPIFYQQPWCDSTGRITCYRKLPHKVAVSPNYPEGTGFEPNLWALNHPDPEVQNVLEAKMFSNVDSWAAPVVKLLVEDQLSDMTAEQGSDFVRFLLSLRARSPDVVNYLKTVAPKEFQLELDKDVEEYKQLKSPNDPELPSEWIELRRPGHLTNLGLNILTTLTHKSMHAERFMKMQWLVQKFDKSDYDLLTSDRPLITIGLENQGKGFVALPLSPRRLFIATENPSYVVSQIRKDGQSKVAKRVNETIVAQAEHRVYGSSNQHLRFVERRIAKNYVAFKSRDA